MAGGARARARAFIRQKERELEKIHEHIDGIHCKLETPHVTIDHSTWDVRGHQQSSNLIFGRRWSDTIAGGDKADCLYGRQGRDTLQGHGGDDYILGGEGDDTLNGGDGDDILIGSWGSDTIHGGAGIDTVVYEHRPVRVTLSDTGPSKATEIMPWYYIYNREDTLFDVENIWGSTADDHITGNNQDNEIFGRSGNDHLNGGGGNDTLKGGWGNDRLTGGAGADRFVIDVHAKGHDVITDFNREEGDKLDFSLFSQQRHDFGLHIAPSEDVITLHFNGATVTLLGISDLSIDDIVF